MSGHSLRGKTGERSGLFNEEITPARVAEFAAAVCSTAPLGGVPPTFYTILRRGEFELFQRLGIALSSVLHAEQEYVYLKPLSVGRGTHVSCDTEVTKFMEKKGRETILKFMTFETRIFQGERSIEDQTPIGLSRTTIVIREKV